MQYFESFIYLKKIEPRLKKLFLLIGLLILSSIGRIKAQEIDLDSIRSGLLGYINQQRALVQMEELVSTQVMENASQDQANYCSEIKQETPVQKELKKSTTALRVTFHGGIKDGLPQEIILSEVTSGKGKTLSEGEILDKMFKKMGKFKKVYLRADLYYAGVGAAFDPLTNKVFISIVMGDINIINNAEAHSKELDKNYKVNTYGGHWWFRRMGCKIGCLFGNCDDGTVCPNVDDFKAWYSTFDMDKAFYIKESKLYLKEDFKKYFIGDENSRTSPVLIADNNDRLLVHVIELSQFPCNTSYNISAGGSSQADLSIALKPITLSQLKAKGDLAIDKLPEGFSENFEIGIKVAKYCDEKVKCDVWSFYDKLHRLKPYFSPAKYEELPLLLDTQSAKTPEAYVEQKKLMFKIPFEKNKFEFKQEDIAPFIDSLNEPRFIIQKIQIVAYSSIEGDSIKNQQLQEKRAASIVKVLEMQQSGAKINYTVKQGNSWDMFKKQIVLTNWYYLADSSQAYVRSRLDSDTALLRKLEPLLKEERFATIDLAVAFDLKKLPPDEYWTYRFNKAMERKDIKRAQSNQTALIKLYKEGKIDYKKFMAIQIPKELKYVNLLNNQYVFVNDPNEQIQKFEELRKVDPNNPIVKYNYLALKINAADKFSEEQRREEMFTQASLFNSINATAIPANIRNTLVSRFYPILNENKKQKKPETYKNIQDLSKNSPVIEALAIADFYAEQKRFDIATQVLLDHYNELEETNMIKEYSLRILYFAKASGSTGFDKQFIVVFKKLQKADPELFCKIFNEKQVSYKFFENLHIKKLYCDQCGGK